MRALREIAEFLASRKVLSQSQQERLTELGVISPPHREYDDYYRYGHDIADEYNECPRCENWDCRCPGGDICAQCGKLPCQCSAQPIAQSRRKPKPSERVTAKEIGERIEAQQLLDMPSLKVLERFETVLLNELDDFLLTSLKSDLRADTLWEALSFDKFYAVVSEEENYGQAAHAWAALLQGLSRESLGNKSWILAQHPALGKVWTIQQIINSVLRSLGRLIEEETLVLAEWSNADFHPLGSPAMGLVYVTMYHSLEWPPQGEQRPVWSPWDGQRRAARWKHHPTEENPARLWELALKMSPTTAFQFMERFSITQEYVMPILTHPQAWRALKE